MSIFLHSTFSPCVIINKLLVNEIYSCSFSRRISHKQLSSWSHNTFCGPSFVFVACLIKVDQSGGNLYWVSCDQNRIGTITAASQYPQQLYQTTNKIQDLYLDWLRGSILWLEGERILTMSMMGGKSKELLHLAAGVGGNITFDLRANSLLWNSKGAGLSLL